MESITLFNTVYLPHTYPLLFVGVVVVFLGVAGLVYTILANDL